MADNSLIFTQCLKPIFEWEFVGLNVKIIPSPNSLINQCRGWEISQEGSSVQPILGEQRDTNGSPMTTEQFQNTETSLFPLSALAGWTQGGQRLIVSTELGLDYDIFHEKFLN